jgi:transcriptional regulator with XRE-family HTH domain
MTLREYLQSHGLTSEAFAKLVPCSDSYPWMLANGKATPGWRMAKRIERITGGAVPASNWFKEESGEIELSDNVEETISELMKKVKK